MTGNGDELKNDVGNGTTGKDMDDDDDDDDDDEADLKTDSTLLLVNSEMFDISISLSDEVIDDEFSIGIKMEDFENSDNNSSGGSESEISIKEKEIELNHQQDKKNLFQAIPSADEKLHKRLSDVDEQGENFNASKAEREQQSKCKMATTDGSGGGGGGTSEEHKEPKYHHSTRTHDEAKTILGQKKNLTKNDDSTFQTVQYAESELLRMRKAVTKESSSQNTQKSDATQPVTGKK
ncbi:hypothetical protein T01_10860 [Trichinella spiralis]|uniref:Uncharacterized protein n=1 Tax=Trichinella spiralis TaxID=6334 RepID=A0A0V1BZF7_TRISP|nr:hypothetical protein T01_10860 [Trichinella spiralis]